MPDDSSDEQSTRSEADTGNRENHIERANVSGWSRFVSLVSMVNAASLISVFIGLCYFYNFSYRQAFFGSFGLDAAVVPISVPDAVVEGFFGIVTNVMLVITLVAAFILIYVVLTWFLSRRLERLANRFGIPSEQPLPHPALIELGKTIGFRTSYVASIITLSVMAMSFLAVLVIGLPAEKAAAKNVAAVRAKIISSKPECASFGVKGSTDLVGWRIGSSPDRQFILANDNAVHVLKFDDFARLDQTPTACKKLTGSSKPPAR